MPDTESKYTGARPVGALPERLHLLDASRGLAALSVVFWHWQHFFAAPGEAKPETLPPLPWHRYFFVLYDNGGIAVNYFFALSGFIFFWLYQDAVAERRMGLWRFAVLRFSRLYPLYFATLMAAVLLQAVYFQQHSAYFVYTCNDLYHFVLSLFMASQWGFQRDLSFNGPAWSISYEVLLYALFFVTCVLRLNRPWHLALLVLVSVVLRRSIPNNTAFGYAAAAFYCGGLACHLAKKLAAPEMRRAGWIVIAMCATGWIMAVAQCRTPWVDAACAWAGAVRLQHYLHSNYVFSAGLFPLTLVALAFIECHYSVGTRWTRVLGEISYSSYLLHFPLQLAWVVAAAALGWDTGFFTSRAALLLFFVLLIALSLASYRGFERPAQRYLRSRLLK